MSEFRYVLRPGRALFKRGGMIYGHFIEHFHRQIYGGIYDPGSPLADENGLRTDVTAALKKIRVPVLRWPGGCFVSAYHWKKAVGPARVPVFDKAWRVEEPNTFGTDEYIALCREVGCEPYICANAGTGTPEEMSDWVEYCNLEREGEHARARIAGGHPEPYRVRYWSIGNENYGSWEIGAKEHGEWGRLVREAAKMMRRVDPGIELSAAALTDIDWNVDLLKACGDRLDWISIHKYWNLTVEEDSLFTYGEAMACTNDLDTDIRKARGLLTAMGLEKQIRIAVDEWNLRGWHHPGVMGPRPETDREKVLTPRDRNDLNSSSTMADAVFTACFLNALNRHGDIVGMGCFSPAVNGRGILATYDKGLVKRGTYHVFDLYVNCLGDEVLDGFAEGTETMRVRRRDGRYEFVPVLDVLFTRSSKDGCVAVAAVNKHPDEARVLSVVFEGGCPGKAFRVLTVNGPGTDSFNDKGAERITLKEGPRRPLEGELRVSLAPHSVNVIRIGEQRPGP